MAKPLREQHIAVFGESGSGKTVLLSSFYGAYQEAAFQSASPFHVVADDIGQGQRLLKNYYGMKRATQLPAATRFDASSYAFSLRLRPGLDADGSAQPAAGSPGVAAPMAPESSPSATTAKAPKPAKPPKPGKSAPAGMPLARIVWHDYPGEWFEQDVSGPEEAARRVATFRSLLVSDVAVLLIDGQRLLEHRGEEERYLRPLFTGIQNGLLSLRTEILPKGEPLVDAPRIWMLALSKADLLPEMSTRDFQELVIEKAADELGLLRETLRSFVRAGDALAVGEDFLRLSSARFQPGTIDVSTRVGLDLLLPVAAMLPMQRHLRWARTLEMPRRVVDDLLSGADGVKAVLPVLATGLGVAARAPLPPQIRTVLKGASVAVSAGAVVQLLDLVGDDLVAANRRAMARKDHLSAVLTGFLLDLERGERDGTLVRSPR
ncbi:ATP/GTP-binding protein [Brachybacterium sp. J144]|uniref:ATP/GTP-binding protein n=1 Tax=Brachybacterium sp. J144 TaxID=3116487 RepID=UPI002E7A0FB6|nr:ATP/GTP-binding protein [Brachybacterium sp. J144]MEE1650741.1 ATP/GTP-binding protein [Brachybacterium sp. J144]